MDKILDQLNEAQREAAQHIDGPMLILAGAGSGKTKTITTRLAYLLSLGIDPANTLTLTFTNKAATEMRERALSMIESPVYPPLLCTFHKFGLLFLKFNIGKLGRKNDFVVIDTDDKKRIIKQIDKELPTALVASEISRYKNSLIKPDQAIAQAEHPQYKKIAAIYKTYQDYITENNLVDFDDLLMLTHELLEMDDALRKSVSERYRYIMVDEYQDTNELQLQLLKKLCDTHTNLCVVGDDDQSIYGWRGANIRNILEFSNMFDNTKVVKLENNYRSTEEILTAANLLIQHNRSRLGLPARSPYSIVSTPFRVRSKRVSTVPESPTSSSAESDSTNGRRSKMPSATCVSSPTAMTISASNGSSTVPSGASARRRSTRSKRRRMTSIFHSTSI